jgi:hypothetical protein
MDVVHVVNLDDPNVVEGIINQSITLGCPLGSSSHPAVVADRGLASVGLTSPHCVDQAFPNCPIMGVVSKHLAFPSHMEVSLPHCGRGNYIIPM